jgi:hypothetical protein
VTFLGSRDQTPEKRWLGSQVGLSVIGATFTARQPEVPWEETVGDPHPTRVLVVGEDLAGSTAESIGDTDLAAMPSTVVGT